MGAPKGTASWNAGTGKGWTDRRGYRWIRVNGKSVREHRHVMEQHLGRKLIPTEVVHHRNGDTADNRLDNLEVMLGGDHMRRHHKGVRRPDMAKQRMSRAARDRETIRRLSSSNSDLLEALQKADRHLSMIGWPRGVDGCYDKAGEWTFSDALHVTADEIEVTTAFHVIRNAIVKATGEQP